MPDSLAALVLAAGAGTRLAPLTRVRPKPLCPVAGVALVDHALGRVGHVTARQAVNVHHGRDQMVAHLDGRAHLSIEEVAGLGTAGAIGHLRPWLDGDDVLVVNGDTWCTADLAPVVEMWDRQRVRVVVSGPAGRAELDARSRIVASLLPWAVASTLAGTPSGLYEVCWRPWQVAGRLDVVGAPGPFVDCATPRDYLAANMAATGGRSFADDAAEVDGELQRAVVWAGARVHRGERLVDAIRVSDAMTVLVR
jgi:MurNAc alpha-1-phosphate uridylyltransferase